MDVTVDNLRPQVDSICYGAISATRAVLPPMVRAGSGTVLYTTGASSVTPTPWAATAGAAGAALRNWALTLNSALADKGIYVGHVAIGAWIAGTPSSPPDRAVTRASDLQDLLLRWPVGLKRTRSVNADGPGP